MYESLCVYTCIPAHIYIPTACLMLSRFVFKLRLRPLDQPVQGFETSGLRFGARFQASLPTIATPFASICYFCCCLDLCRLVVIIASFLCWWSYSKREPESHNAKMLNPGPRFPRSLEKSCAAERHRHADNGERPL